MKISGR